MPDINAYWINVVKEKMLQNKVFTTPILSVTARKLITIH